MSVSVIIPTCGRPGLLGRCLRAVAAQEAAGEYEVIIVDDAGHPSAVAVVNEARAWFGAATPLTLLRLPANAGPAAARNAGWRQARHDVIAFTDDDTLPAPDWLHRGQDTLRRENALAVAGGVRVPLGREPTDYERNESGLEKAEFVTANCFVRKETLERLGGFDERFRAAWREDSDLHFRLLKLAAATGRQVVRDPAALVVHPVRPAAWGVSLRQQRKAFYNALLFKKHPEQYRRGIQSGPPVLYYASAAAALAALGGLAAGRSMVAAAAAGLWAVCFAVFLARRLRGTSRRPSHLVEMAVTTALIPFLSLYWRLRGALAFKVWFA